MVHANSDCWVVLPVKDFVNAKQRLSGVLSPSERRALSQAMVEDMLVCLQGINELAGVVLVSDDPAAELIAYRYGARLLQEKGSSNGLNAAVQQAAEYLEDQGSTRMLVLHGDLPLVRPESLRALLKDRSAQVSLVADRCQSGTNGLLCSVPAPIAFCYGNGSLQAHQKSCEEKGLSVRTVSFADLSLDVDTPQDLIALAEAIDSDTGLKTAQVLVDYDIPRRLQTMALDSDTPDSDTLGEQHRGH